MESSEQFRHECECRMVAGLPGEGRIKYLGLVAEKRSEAAAARLKQDVFALLEANGRKECAA